MRVTVRLGDEVGVALAERAAFEDRPVAWLVRRALEEFLSGPSGPGGALRVADAPVAVPRSERPLAPSLPEVKVVAARVPVTENFVADLPKKVVPDIPGLVKGSELHQHKFQTWVRSVNRYKCECGVWKP